MSGFLKNLSLKCARCAPTTYNETSQDVYENKNKIHNIQSAVMVIIMVHGLDEAVPIYTRLQHLRERGKTTKPIGRLRFGHHHRKPRGIVKTGIY